MKEPVAHNLQLCESLCWPLQALTEVEATSTHLTYCLLSQWHRAVAYAVSKITRTRPSRERACRLQGSHLFVRILAGDGWCIFLRQASGRDALLCALRRHWECSGPGFRREAQRNMHPHLIDEVINRLASPRYSRHVCDTRQRHHAPKGN